MRPTLKLVLAALFVLSPLVANAVPITWTIIDSTSSSQGGVFDFDADTGTYSNVDVSGCCGEDYNLLNGAAIDVPNSSASQLKLLGYVWPDSLLMEFAAPLTNLGGVINVAWYELLNSQNVSNTNFWDSGTMTVSALGVEPTPVPEPTTLALLGLGLGGLAFARRKKV